MRPDADNRVTDERTRNRRSRTPTLPEIDSHAETRTDAYDEAQIAERLRALPGWYFEDGWIRRVYKTDGWPTTLMLVNAIGYLAEAAYHHPDLVGDLGPRHGQAVDAQRRRDHRQGLRAGAPDRGRRAVASRGAAAR